MIVPADEVLSRLTSRLKGSMNIRPVLLLGAGASVSSGVPLARQCVIHIVRRYLLDALHIPNSQDIADEPVRLEKWIKEQSWAPNYHDLAELFPIVVEKFLNPTALRTDYLIEVISMSKLSEGYKHLGQMMDRHIFKTILTTNFDECLPSMFHELSPQTRLTEVGRWPNDTREFRLNNKQIIWMHGRLEQYSARNTIDEVDDLDALIVANAAVAVREAPLIVVGYRGSERSIMEKFFGAHAKEPLFFKHGIYWCSPDREMHPNVAALQDAVGAKDFFWLPINCFDNLMEDLDWSLFDTDHSKPPFRGWSPWTNCLSKEQLVLFTWTQQHRTWRRTSIQKADIDYVSGDLILFNNITRNSIEHIQIGSNVVLDGDFSVEIEISGDFYELKLQNINLYDQNLYLTPSNQGISSGNITKYCIKRVGARIAVVVWEGGRWRTLELSHYDVDGRLELEDLFGHKFFFCINLFKEARVTVHSFRIRVSRA